MPTYDYECSICGKFEHFQPMNENPIFLCPMCNNPVKRLISGGAGIVFKGSGFYVNDSKNKP